MTLSTCVPPSEITPKAANSTRPKWIRRMAAVSVAAPLLGLFVAAWMDWNDRGQYEPLGYYVFNSWNSWRAPKSTGQPADSILVPEHPQQMAAGLTR